MKSSSISQHKSMAMGQKLKIGGPVLLKTGIPDSPMEKAKRDNGVPGMKKGGKAMPRKAIPGNKSDD